MWTTFRYSLPLTVVWPMVTTSLASAEWFVDLYGGGAFLQDSDVNITSDKTSIRGPSGNRIDDVSVRATLKDLEGDDFPFFGVRAGYWLESIPYLGFGIDFASYQLHTPAQKVRARSNVALDVEIDGDEFTVAPGLDVPVRMPPIGEITGILAFDFMLRRPFLTSTQFPKGRLQPYLTAAPALMFTDDDPEVELGLKIGTGLVWQFHKRWALFAEYRFTYFSPEISGISASARVAGLKVKVKDPKIEMDFLTHYALAGLRFAF